MANKPQFKKEDFLKAIDGSRGLKTVVCKKVGCEYKTLQRYLTTYPELEERLRQERATMDDFAEAKLYELISEKNPAVCIFYAKTRMRSRGYVERHQHEVGGIDGKPIEAEFKVTFVE